MLEFFILKDLTLKFKLNFLGGLVVPLGNCQNFIFLKFKLVVAFQQLLNFDFLSFNFLVYKSPLIIQVTSGLFKFVDEGLLK